MKKLMLDIGHGGVDKGASSNGLLEKDINLKVGLLIKEYLESYEVEINLTRETDTTISPDNRVSLVDKYNPDLCVSIHHNAASKSSARGAEVIHAHYDEYDDRLALAILSKLALAGMPSRRTFTRLNGRGSDWYYMIRRIWDADTDAIIVEGGFITNNEDAEMLKKDSYLFLEAKAIGEAIVEYLNLKAKKTYHWGDSEVKELKSKGLIKEIHKSEDIVTWAEFATVINRLWSKIRD